MHYEGPLVLALTLGLWSGCLDDTGARDGEGNSRAPSNDMRTAAARGPIVARVDGDPIALAEVKQLCSATGLSVREALQRLVSERLLVRHASSEGYGELAVVARAARQAQVRALLARAVEVPEASASMDPRTGPSPAGLVAEREKRLERLLTELAQQAGVKYDELAIQHVFKGDSP